MTETIKWETREGRVVTMTKRAAEVALATGENPDMDVRALLCGIIAEKGLREICIEGAEDDEIIAAWNEYVDAVARVAESERAR